MGEKTLCELISIFKFLRTLNCYDSGIEKLPSSICELKHLTFLDLSKNEGIIRLPDSVTRLQNLQVLKLNMCCKLIELPRDIRKLVNLRQLEISNCNALSHMPHGLGQLTLLRTLTDFLLPGDDYCPKNYGGLGELNRLSHLRGCLNIEVKGEKEDAVAESNAANLKEKDSLVSLVLVMQSLPPLGELTSLKRLEIGELPIVEYTESDLHALSSLPNLSALRIWECPKMEWIPPLLHIKELKLPSFPLESLQTSVATIEHVIGMDDQVKDVLKLLEIDDDEVGVRIVGIHGTNGIGKTTIGKAVYDRLSSYFNSCSFLTEIGETTQNVGGIQFVQTKLIYDILERDGDVLLSKESHLDDLVRDLLNWFGSGSRILVTSENSGILHTYVSQGLARIYELNYMDSNRALELFHKHALGSHGLIPGYPEIGKRIVKAMGRVPFIEVIGSLLRGKTIEDWKKIEDLIKPWKENSQEILKDCGEILKICYKA
ncbi:uncharacterized protein LOC130139239 [Syzygium oleosum]|uniref:uncharacterized protein LOC130139239 n=1 Tax=Syzygium oleosum TaxID=219896 RepID=UPI0024B89598|nr:uncharacterized protein LOC130139239 [Syzygium oleosum]